METAQFNYRYKQFEKGLSASGRRQLMKDALTKGNAWKIDHAVYHGPFLAQQAAMLQGDDKSHDWAASVSKNLKLSAS